MLTTAGLTFSTAMTIALRRREASAPEHAGACKKQGKHESDSMFEFHESTHFEKSQCQSLPAFGSARGDQAQMSNE